jgi:hypothetical protein
VKTWLKRSVKWSPVIALALLIAFWRLGVQHWLAVHTGSANTPGSPPNYNFWSGFGSDVQELTLLGVVAGMWHHVNCHDPGCWRIGRHKVDGTPYCNRHHEAARRQLRGTHRRR